MCSLVSVINTIDDPWKWIKKPHYYICNFSTILTGRLMWLAGSILAVILNTMVHVARLSRQNDRSILFATSINYFTVMLGFVTSRKSILLPLLLVAQIHFNCWLCHSKSRTFCSFVIKTRWKRTWPTSKVNNWVYTSITFFHCVIIPLERPFYLIFWPQKGMVGKNIK